MSASTPGHSRRAIIRCWSIAAAIGLGLSFAPSPILAEPQDRQVAEWALLLGGSVRIEGRADRVRDVTKLPEGDFSLELVDLVGTNILPPDLKWLSGLSRLKV